MSAPRRKRRTMSLTWLMIGGLGGVMALGMFGVLAVGLNVARQNTFQLAQMQAQGLVERVQSTIRNHLEPAGNYIEAMMNVLSASDNPRTSSVIETMSITLKAFPQIESSGFYMNDGYWVHVDRNGVVSQGNQLSKWINSARPALNTARNITWGRPNFDPIEKRMVLSGQRPIFRDGVHLGFIVAEISTAVISDSVRMLDFTAGGTFVLYGDEQLIAHSSATTSQLEKITELRQTGAKAVDLEDRILMAFLKGAGEPIADLNANTDIKGRNLRVDGENIMLIYREIAEFGDQPWLIGAYMRPSETAAGKSFKRVEIGAYVGGGLLILTLITLYWITVLVRRPVAALAQVSRAVRRLDFSDRIAVRGSFVREFDEAAEAINNMVSGLRWFQIYVPKTLVHTLMTRDDPESALIQNRSVTILFSDIAGFTGLSETLDAAAVVKLLNSHFTAFNSAIENEGGTLDKFIGDAVMAFWGAPVRQADHAARACRAALVMAEAVRRDNEQRVRRGEPLINVRIGLHSGPVVVGNIGAPGRINYTIVGDSVNTANRIETLGKSVDPEAEICVLVSQATVDEAGPDFEFVAVGDFTLRGRSQAVKLYRLVGMKANQPTATK